MSIVSDAFCVFHLTLVINLMEILVDLMEYPSNLFLSYNYM